MAQREINDEHEQNLIGAGTNHWRDEEAWPLARAKNTKYFLHSGGKANSLRGNGSLSTAVPAREAADQYVYDPGNPVPTIGGPLCCDGTHLPPGPRDQRAVEGRDDVLVYSTPPMTEDTEITGPLAAQLDDPSREPPDGRSPKAGPPSSFPPGA